MLELDLVQSSTSEKADTTEELEQSLFYMLYEQRKKDLQKQQSPLIKELFNLDESSLYSILNDEEEMDKSDSNQISNYTDLVARTLQMPHTQVYYQASTNPVEGFSKMLEKARRQIRRTKAKDRNPKGSKLSSSAQSVSGNDTKTHKTSKKLSTLTKQNEEIDIPNEDLSKRQIQMIRNRISAQNSRDRKKVYMQKLEDDREKMKMNSRSLENKVELLTQQLQMTSNMNEQLQKQIQELKVLNYKYQNSLICRDCLGTNILHDGNYNEYPELDKRASQTFC